MVEVAAADGPLEEQRLGWVAHLYGAVDPKYLELGFLEHLLVRGQAGPALHAFALADGQPVGHATVVPMHARHGRASLRAGKLEALVVAESHRGGSVARPMLDALYELTDARGIELLHAYVQPHVGRVIGFTALAPAGRPSLVALLGPQGPAQAALSAAQRGASALASVVAGARGRSPVLRALSRDDFDLLAAPHVGDDQWAVVADGAFDWYASSPYVRVLELPDPHGSRALVQLPASPQEPVRIAAWQARHDDWRAATLALAAAAHVGREAEAATLRLQDPRPSPTLVHVARWLGFVPRHDLTTLWVRSNDPLLARAEAVVPTTMLYLGF